MSEQFPKMLPGSPHPLGATYDGKGVNFAVFSERATRVDLCLFDPDDPRREIRRLPFTENTHLVWHGYVPGLRPGALYGFRAHGRFDPEEGYRFNPNKLLVDPYARAISGKPNWKAPLAGYTPESELEDLSLDERDSAWGCPKSVVVDGDFDWEGVRPPRRAFRDSLIYELHVKGLTAKHPEVPPELRGTYTGLTHPAVLEHLLRLGVTAVELMPVHEAVDDGFLVDRGLKNYWGYSTLGFFAPDQRFSSRGSRGGQVREFKAMVKALHQAGIEVILDVVYNHTCEGNHMGPTLSLKGLDNQVYYWLMPDDPRYYLDFTGTGNSINVNHPQSLKLVCDSLRYWVTEMHVDGFRFDLATTLGRTAEGEFDRLATFFQVLHQDPVLSQVKLIVEPWDVGLDGYKLANFPLDFAEWNGRYRETIRRYWKGDERQAAEIGYRLTGSSDLFKLSARRPTASINYVCVHDGFTLHDLVSYNHKHNERNGEGNRDGADDNYSWNHGHEGETKDRGIIALRERQKRNLIATLFISQGTPLLCAGDELGRTQNGNNNAYCQDNDISWIDWNLDERRRSLLEFTRWMSALRREQPVLRRRQFFQGRTIGDSRFHDLVWFRPDGAEMNGGDWDMPYCRSLGFLLGGDAIPSREPDGRRPVGDTLLVLLNAHHEPVPFTLPALKWGKDWDVIVDTARPGTEGHVLASGKVTLEGRALLILKLCVPAGPRESGIPMRPPLA